MSPTPMPTPTRLTGSAARVLPEWEQILILDAAGRFGVDAPALAALRLAENGGPGREYGVLSVPAPTYQEQLDVAARSFKASEDRYTRATGQSPRGADGRYTDAFLTFFSARWAPVGAENDPRNLNTYHAGNLIAYHAATGVA